MQKRCNSIANALQLCLSCTNPSIYENIRLFWTYFHWADSRVASSQWETVLHCNDVSHWLDASRESALFRAFDQSDKHYAYFPALQLWWLNNTGLLGHFCNWAAGKYSNQWPVRLDSCNRNYCNAQWIFHNWPKLGFHQFDATNIESIPAQVWKLYVLFYFYFFAVVSSIVDVWWTQNKWHQLTILSQTNRTTQKMILVQKEVRHFSNL